MLYGLWEWRCKPHIQGLQNSMNHRDFRLWITLKWLNHLNYTTVCSSVAMTLRINQHWNFRQKNRVKLFWIMVIGWGNYIMLLGGHLYIHPCHITAWYGSNNIKQFCICKWNIHGCIHGVIGYSSQIYAFVFMTAILRWGPIQRSSFLRRVVCRSDHVIL